MKLSYAKSDSPFTKKNKRMILQKKGGGGEYKVWYITD